MHRLFLSSAAPGLALASIASLAGCASDSAASAPATPSSSEAATTMTDCPVLASRNWKAWIDAMPGTEGGQRLHISGEVDLPTPGFTIEWREGPADRAMPPGLRMRLILTKPSGMVTQVVTPTPVSYAGKSFSPSYRMIIVGCGDKALATITDIPTVH